MTGKFDLLIFVSTKKVWLVSLGQEGFAQGWGNCLKYLKRGWNRKEGKGHKDFKKSSRGRCLKKGGWNHLTNYSHSWGGSLTNPMFITAFVQFQPEGSNKKDVNASFTFKCTYLHLTQIPPSTMNSFSYHGHNWFYIERFVFSVYV